MSYINVVVSGGFDPLHVGHLAFLEAAGQLDHRLAMLRRLAVLLEGDEWLSRKHWPTMPQQCRAELLSGLTYVDCVTCLDEPTACKELERLRPDIYAVGIDHADMDFPEADTCKRLGIRVEVVRHKNEHIHSSMILENYPKPKWVNPPMTVDALIVQDGKVLVIRRGNGDGEGLLDLPGGFVELGETLEQAVEREVREEVGLAIERVAYRGSKIGFYSDRRQVINAVFSCCTVPWSRTHLTGEASEFLWVDQMPDGQWFNDVCRQSLAHLLGGVGR